MKKNLFNFNRKKNNYNIIIVKISQKINQNRKRLIDNKQLKTKLNNNNLI